ncbi:hypothetical protein N7478_005678 [Penicillium angulare]|uniref:uncharacterized protein n=1 Tax=Penicillium angulare TaxID=116970 RepID=UPI002540F713|nr:uncharacterized protein N7478_005678 [Penicillium angulare]KAJ5280306.1 hypothetical protein N7478_005678 [Penicillium angulare]
MAPNAPLLPSRFPCWCRAVYSWGGETTRDLGFVEGDLIECLNAGDGQWWMGRLRRDKRAVGLFPSNFVELMSEDFVPISRDTSPMVQATSSPINNPTSAPKKQKTVFRKPFQAHKEALSPASNLARSRSNTPVTSSVPQTPPRDGGGTPRSKPLRTHASAVKNQGSVSSRPSSVSSRHSSRGPSPRASVETERPPSNMMPRGSISSSRQSSREVSPFPRESSPMHRESSPLFHQSSQSRREHSPLPPRATSPMPHRGGSTSSYHAPSMPPHRPVSPMYYEDPRMAQPPDSPMYQPEPPMHRTPSPLPHRAPSPMYHQGYQGSPMHRAPSPLPHREPSPMYHQELPMHRQPSPLPYRAASPMYQPEPPMHRTPSPLPQRAASPMYYPEPTINRAQSPLPHRAASPMYQPEPPTHRQPSPLPSRSVSPMPYRAYSPIPPDNSDMDTEERDDSPPPPPPPPHRVAVNRAQSHSPQPPMHSPAQQRGLLRSPQPPTHSPKPPRSPAPLNMNDRYVIFSRTPSPGAISTHSAQSDMNGNTPSPLRDAMEDVMTSLEDMGLPREPPSPSPHQPPSPSPIPTFNNPWSADALESMDEKTPTANRRRPLTSLGFDGYKQPHRGELVHRNSAYSHDHYMDGPPQLNNYVQRMESRLRQLEDQNRPTGDNEPGNDDQAPPPPPPKHSSHHARHNSIPAQYPHVRSRRSGQDLRNDRLNRTFTNKSSATTSTGVQSVGTDLTTSTDKTSQSLMSGASAGGFSATSAGSYARRNGTNQRPNTAMDTIRSRGFSDAGNMDRPESPMTGVSYHSSHNTSRQGASSAIPWSSNDHDAGDSGGVFGGLSTPKSKKQGFFKKIFDSAKTGAASARSSISVGRSGSQSPTKGSRMVDAVSPLLTSHMTRDSARDTEVNTSAIDWVQVRRDVNRASSPSRNERIDRAERCQMMDHPVIYAVEELHDTAEGDESIDGSPISDPTNFIAGNLTLVDKSARFINSVPPMTNPTSLAQGYICRPYKSDVQRLRAIFTWVSEKIAWEEPVDGLEVDMKRVLQAKRGSPQEIAILVNDMCTAVGLHSEVIFGFLKSPGDTLDLESLTRPNHWWNAVLVDGEWRIMDCALANPTNPQRSKFVTNNSSIAESWYFLAQPLDICYTHVPLYPEEQHICPPISPDVLLALPAVCPQYFKLNAKFPDYDTSLTRLEGLECMQICLVVPPDVECAAEVEAPAFAYDADGDFFESGDIVRKRALVQPDWFNGQKRITVKAVLPGDEGQGVLKVYAGKKGLMHSSKDIPHPLALALPILHTGENPPYDFVLRHPTPHAQRHDLYIMQPQCSRLAVNNTFVFGVRQHPASAQSSSKDDFPTHGRASPSVFNRPSSALSMVSSTAGASTVSSASNEFSASTSAISSTRSASGREKPAKLAIQSPSGKILRLSRKAEHMISPNNPSDSIRDAAAEGSVWETVIKIGERGTWRGLVLADRVARWCVFCEWECV